MAASLQHRERVLRHLEEQERAIFAQAAEQVDRVIGPKRIAELLAIFEIDIGTTRTNVLGTVPAGDRRPVNADMKNKGE